MRTKLFRVRVKIFGQVIHSEYILFQQTQEFVKYVYHLKNDFAGKHHQFDFKEFTNESNFCQESQWSKMTILD